MWESILNNTSGNPFSGGNPFNGGTPSSGGGTPSSSGSGSGGGSGGGIFGEASQRLRADSQNAINFMQLQGQLGRERMIAAAEERNKTSGLNMMINTARTCWTNAEQIAR